MSEPYLPTREPEYRAEAPRSHGGPPVHLSPPLDPPRRSILYRPIDLEGFRRRLCTGLRGLGTPWMTLGIALFLILAALGQLAAGGFRWQLGEIASNPINWALGAKAPSLIAHGEYWRLVTASFLHGSWVPHLLANLFSLMVLGLLIEHYYGPARMFAIFVVACVSGTVASHFFTASTSLGASTGIMGLLGALLVHNFRYRRYLPDRLNGVYPLLIAMLFVQLTMDVLSRGVDIAGHIGGLLGGGVAGGLLGGRLAPRHRPRDYVPLPLVLVFCVGTLLYGAWGLATALPQEGALLRAGRARTFRARVPAMEEALRRRPYFLEAEFHLIELLAARGRMDEARPRLERLFAANPGLWNERRARRYRSLLVGSWLQAAETAFANQQWTRAVEAYTRVVQLAEQREVKAEAYNGAAWTLADKLNTRLEEAERHAWEANQLRPNHPAYMDTLAWVYYRQARYPEALTQQAQAVRVMELDGRALPNTRAEMYYHLGAIQEELGRKQDAVGSYRRALSAMPAYGPALEGLHRLEPPPPPPPRPAPGKVPPAPPPSLDPAVIQGLL